MVDVRRVKLPGVGVLHTFVTDDGGKLGVITHRSGHSDLITFADAEDGDARKVSLRLDEDEAHTLAELLGGTRITEVALGHGPDPRPEHRLVPGGLRTPHRRPAARIADQQGPPGVTVVAVVRGESANPAPDGDFKVFPGDTLVVAGAPEKVAKAFQFFRTGEFTKAPAEHSAPPGG